MSALRGNVIVAWLERWGERFIKGTQPDIYQMLQLHVGGTDMLRQYSGTETYWQNVQTVLDCFFSSAQRAEMCVELINDELFIDDCGFGPFLYQARAELRCRELISMIEKTMNNRNSLRSVS